MTIKILFGLCLLRLCSGYAQPKNLFTPEVKQLLSEINIARANPTEYGIKKELIKERLDTLKSKGPFILNYSLCQKANRYAEQLSKAKYNENAISVKHSEMGYHESIALSTKLDQTLYQLILDKGSEFKGHRFHLLSVNNKDTKIGIGIAYIVQLEWYVIVIITE
jgi:hypothetical protein